MKTKNFKGYAIFYNKEDKKYHDFHKGEPLGIIIPNYHCVTGWIEIFWDKSTAESELLNLNENWRKQLEIKKVKVIVIK